MGSGDVTSLIPGQGESRPGDEIIEGKEFDLTQVSKQLALGIPVVMGGLLGALELLGVDKAFETPGYVIAALGVTAVALLGLAIVSAADILGRSYVQAHMASSATSATGGTDEADDVQDRQDRLAKELQEREDRLTSERQDREDRLAKERQDREDRLAKERQDREDRLAKERQDREDRLAKESQARDDGRAKERHDREDEPGQ